MTTGLDASLAALPEHLSERVRRYNKAPLHDGAFVLYWVRSAVRSEENPALDISRLLAVQWSLPVLVYQGLSEHYPYASDRHHTFMLQGARDLQQDLARRGIAYAFHLAGSHDRGPHLKDLARQAAVVVTEDMPVDGPLHFLRSLTESISRPILCVDTACVVPMQLTGKAFDRAFQFRNATKALYAERVRKEWPEIEADAKTFDLSALPFETIDLKKASIACLVARCRIDHAVGPVTESVGGSEAGYQRWNRFKSQGLASYARRRNNALIDGVSRMSPYLHYGMVSPMRLAREAAWSGNAGAEKFLDELLIWRELAYAFCFYRKDYDQWSAIPAWARETLSQHADDPRPTIYSWEQLARAQTDDELWNAAQQSLLVHGELHNNVRMTWGKAILNWTRSPQEALRMIIDLNHRYALDGRDPASYGGILWCLGQFDRPFRPERPVLGRVRPRTTEQHARRLDPVKYRERVKAPVIHRQTSVAIVGAGLSGLFAARTLADHGLNVTVFEKSRGVGGRMATRRQTDGRTFDHGAQYFTVHDPRFSRYVESWLEQGIVARWPNPNRGPADRFVVIQGDQTTPENDSPVRFVGVPGMNAICKHLARDLNVVKQTRVQQIEPSKSQIRLYDDRASELGTFAQAIVSAPAEQTAELLSSLPDLASSVSDVLMQPCWSAMVSLPEPLTNSWVGAFVKDSFVGWIARNSTKPERSSATEDLVIHATAEWTQEHWDLEPYAAADQMVAELFRVIKRPYVSPVQVQAHRWKYALPLKRREAEYCLFDKDSGIAVCGDWVNGKRVEDAFLSGMAAAGRVLGNLPAAQQSQPVQKSLLR